jgi:glutamyl endopeptidase
MTNQWKDITVSSAPLPGINQAVRNAPPGPVAAIVHGVDNRQRVNNTRQFPASAIAQLAITAADGHTKGAATGTFITPTVLLTAGHAIFVHGSTAAAGRVQKMIVIPARDENDKPFGAVETARFYVPQPWVKHRLADFDYGLVFVPTLVEAGQFKPVALSDDQLRGLGVHISGYPTDRADRPVGTQWFDKGRIADVSAGQVVYDIDTEDGDSGSAVFHFNEETETASIVAVHRFGDGGANFGTRLTPAVIADIKAAIAAHG